MQCIVSANSSLSNFPFLTWAIRLGLAKEHTAVSPTSIICCFLYLVGLLCNKISVFLVIKPLTVQLCSSESTLRQ